MEFNLLKKVSSKRLAIIALIIWMISLTLTGFSIYSNQTHIYGYEILLIGWASPIAGNFAWYANIFFLFSVAKVISGKSIIISSLIAFIISLDLFRYSAHPLGESGALSPVYGLGWGAVLWLLSISILLASSGTREREVKGASEIEVIPEWQRYGGFLFALLIIILSAFFSIYDRINANPSEIERLSGIAFKRETVCSDTATIIGKPHSNFNGTLQIIFNGRISNAKYPFGQVKDLLMWGIPRIQIDSKDYFLKNGELIAQDTKNKASATLHISEKNTKKGYIDTRLIDVSSNREIMNQKWSKEFSGYSRNIYCPNFNSFPSEHIQPRKIIIEALGLSADNKININRKSLSRLDSNLIKVEEGGETKINQIKRLREEITKNTKLRTHKRYNTNCAIGTGYDPDKRTSYDNNQWPFMINNISHYTNTKYGMSICKDDGAYLYGGSASRGRYYLRISKRSLLHFKEEWAHIILFPENITAKRNGVFKVVEIQEHDNKAIIKVVDEDTGKIYTINTLFPKK